MSAVIVRPIGLVLTMYRSGDRRAAATARSDRVHRLKLNTVEARLRLGGLCTGLPVTSVGSVNRLSSHGPGGNELAEAGCTSCQDRAPPVHSRFRKPVTVSEPGFCTGPRYALPGLFSPGFAQRRPRAIAVLTGPSTDQEPGKSISHQAPKLLP